MSYFFILILLLIHASSAQKDAHKWLTLKGDEPLVIARGGFSGLYPDSSQSANELAMSTSLKRLALFCNLQLTKDGVGICLPNLRLEYSTNIPMIFPKDHKTYKVNGQEIQGWFSIDYRAETLFANVSLVQQLYSRPNVFDGHFPISAVEDVMGLKPKKFWLSVQYDMFYSEHKLSVTSYLQRIRSNNISFISSPELGFLKSIGIDTVAPMTKLIFEFRDPEAVEPTTNKKYGEILQDLASIKGYVSGILVPKEYIWPVDSEKYLKPATTLVMDAHQLGLEIYASAFANDMPASYNYSYDPSLEYVQFVDNSKFAVDGLVTDFPATASEAIACFAQLNASNAKVGQSLIITHNGASGEYPGCTDLAYKKAIDDGADIIDCSVQITKDGVVFCQDQPDLMSSSTSMASFMSRATTIPEIQESRGIFSFDLTWSEIQTLKPQIESPFLTSAGFQRNPANKHAGKFMTLASFLELAQTEGVNGIMIDIENASYLASKKGFNIIEATKSALKDAIFDKQSSQKVLIQSDDSSVLSEFQDVRSYIRVLKIINDIGGVPKKTTDEIKKYADAVNVNKHSLITVSNGFAMAKTDVFKEMHAANISVYVSVFRNEYISIAFDYFLDPVKELATFIEGVGVDGVITEYPATAHRYLTSPCSDINKNLSYTILPSQPGALISELPKQAQPPASAPSPQLTPTDIVDPPLPPVANITKNNANTARGSAKGMFIGLRLTLFVTVVWNLVASIPTY